MNEASDRLRAARKAAGFKSARRAAIALGIAQATYIQHENGKRAYSLAQAETYSAFFNGAKLLDHFRSHGLEIPSREVLAALVFDTINTPLKWSAAPEHIADAYREAVDAIFRAFGLSAPGQGQKATSGHPGGR